MHERVPVVNHSNSSPSNNRSRLQEARASSCLVPAMVRGEVDSVLVPAVSPSNNSNSNNRSQDPARTALVMLQAKEGGKMM